MIVYISIPITDKCELKQRFLCDGWKYSKGCVREAEHALLLEKTILFETNYKF